MKRFSRFLFLTLVLLCGSGMITSKFPSPASAQFSDWIQMPSPLLPGGTILSLAISPSTPDTLYALVDHPLGAMLYRSMDGGDSWTYRFIFSPSQDIKRVAINPANPSTIYAGGASGLWRSVNEGFHWEKIAPVGEAFVVVTSDLIYASGRSGPGQGECKDSQYVFLKSFNGGADWTTSDLACADTMDQLAVLTSQPEVVYATGWIPAGRVDRKSIDGGVTWNPLVTPFYLDVYSFLIDPQIPSRLYASSGNGLHSSVDGGKTWSSGPKWIGDRLHLALDGNTLYALNQVFYPTVFYRSDDKGISWWQTVTQLPAGGQALVVSPDHPGRVIAGLLGYGVYRSENGGGVWAEKNAGIFTPARISAIAPAPSNSQILYVTTSSPYPAIMRTLNFGAAWQLLHKGPGIPLSRMIGLQFIPAAPSKTGADPSVLRGAINKIAVHPLDSNIVWAGGEKGIYETRNGTDWMSVASFGAVLDLEVSGIAPDNPYAVMASADSQMGYIFRRECFDWGCNWNGHQVPELFYPMAIAIDPLDPRHIFAASIVYQGNQKVIGIFSSPDAGLTWNQIGVIETDEVVYDLVISPSDANLMMASIGYIPNTYAVCSRDGGKTWSNCSDGLPEFDKYNPVRLVVDFFGQAFLGSKGVYRLAPGVNTWQPFGLEGQTIDALAINSGPSQILFAATDRGLWVRMVGTIMRNWVPFIRR